MNNKLKAGRPAMELWEHIGWIGVWMILATTEGHNRRAFWKQDVTLSSSTDHRFEGAPFRLYDIMARTRFDEILEAHTLYSKPYPSHQDKFHPVRELIFAWNA